MTGTNGKGNKQVGFITNAEQWDRGIAKAKAEGGALSELTRKVVDVYDTADYTFEELLHALDVVAEAKPKGKPARARRSKATAKTGAAA